MQKNVAAEKHQEFTFVYKKPLDSDKAKPCLRLILLGG
jgi:hypothetical protein